MRTKARAGRKPRALIRGQKVLDGISGEELFKNDPTTRRQRGMWVHKLNFDRVTDQEREDQIKAKIR